MPHHHFILCHEDIVKFGIFRLRTIYNFFQVCLCDIGPFMVQTHSRHVPDRSGKSCKLSSSGKFRALQSPQNSGIFDKKWKEIRVLNVGVAWCNLQILNAYPQHITLHSQFLTQNPHFSIILPKIHFIQPQFSISNSSFFILSKKHGIFGSKSPQNRVSSDKMSASAACTACSFFQVCLQFPISSGFLGMVALGGKQPLQIGFTINTGLISIVNLV